MCGASPVSLPWGCHPHLSISFSRLIALRVGSPLPKDGRRNQKQVVRNQGLKVLNDPLAESCFPDPLSHFQFYRINLLAQTPKETQGLSLCLFQAPKTEELRVSPKGRLGRMNSGRQGSDLTSFLPSPSPPPALLLCHETQHPRVSLGWVWTWLTHLSLQGGRIWLIRTSCVVGGFYLAPPLPLR